MASRRSGKAARVVTAKAYMNVDNNLCWQGEALSMAPARSLQKMNSKMAELSKDIADFTEDKKATFQRNEARAKRDKLKQTEQAVQQMPHTELLSKYKDLLHRHDKLQENHDKLKAPTTTNIVPTWKLRKNPNPDPPQG